MDLRNSYGTYIIPKGTQLFRKAKTRDYYPTMFFGFSTASTYSALLHDDSIQIWESVKEIECPLFIRGITASGLVVSAIIDVYNFFWGYKIVDDWQCVEIKRKTWSDRDNFLDYLRSNNIKRWIAPLEDVAHTMELFLFGSIKEHSQLVKFVKYIEKNREGDFGNINSFDNSYFVNNKLPEVSFAHHNPNDPLIQYVLTSIEHNDFMEQVVPTQSLKGSIDSIPDK